MRVLLLHPEDRPGQGEWADSRWDLIVDLGFASPFLYAEWSRELGTRVVSLRQFTGGEDSYRWIGRVLAQGRGRLLDRMGLDWWELAAVWRYQDLEALYLIRELTREIHAASVELFGTRPHPFAALFAQVMSRPVQYLQNAAWAPITSAKRIVRSLRQLSPSQMAEIAFDKWDPHYQVRRQIVKQRAGSREPVVLLPSAYSNVTRTVLAYAAALQHSRFLLAATRRNAVSATLPDNVSAVSLAAYAVRNKQTDREFAELNDAWRRFQHTVLADSADLRIARDAGIFDYFPGQLKNGLFIRDAWLSLMRAEPVIGVLCADDLNYYTRLPLALAARMNLNGVYCSHGALDSGLLFKHSYGGVHLVKGEMEKDYVLRSGAVPPGRVVMAAPPSMETSPHKTSLDRDKVVFFSQPYEIGGGRSGEIYRELVPRLCSLARAAGKRLVIKLHPFESERARARLLRTILPRKADFDSIQIMAGAPLHTLFDQAWCGIGVDSSVAVECTLKGIPFFLCQWLDSAGAGYMQQFARYGAGTLLESPEEMERIPELVSAYQPDHRTGAQLWHDADSELLEAIIARTGPARAAAKIAS
jgi:hypothetical protein